MNNFKFAVQMLEPIAAKRFSAKKPFYVCDCPLYARDPNQFQNAFSSLRIARNKTALVVFPDRLAHAILFCTVHRDCLYGISCVILTMKDWPPPVKFLFAYLTLSDELFPSPFSPLSNMYCTPTLYII